ncbi:MAG: uridine kinase, partial [Planctomycetes bacterium]|nr:uridine kinase [Planctomycetota bacterium]
MRQGIVIGIAGASGSGKTLVAKRIVDHLGPDKAVIIQEDSYYQDLSDMARPERGGMNFDHPDAFDHDLLAGQLRQLLEGESISQPIYDYRTHCRQRETMAVDPASVIILEGILIFTCAELRELMDIRVFVDTPLDICLARRLERDVTERG